jgi:endoglucanase
MTSARKKYGWILAGLFLLVFLGMLILSGCYKASHSDSLIIGDKDYFSTRGLNVFVFNNWYNDYFGDSKMSGIEIIHHEVRTVTNGDVRLSPTPEQWDPIPVRIDRKVDKEKNSIEATLEYAQYAFTYTIRTEADESDLTISVVLEKPLPKELEGKAGFNLEFLPSAYFEKSYLMDETGGIIPLYPGGPMELTADGITEPKAIASGKRLIMAPEDQERKIIVESQNNLLSLYDGRNKAQNGWFVLRSLIPSGKTGIVVKWQITANTIPGWTRKPVVEYSQIGYYPKQTKKAVIELDVNDKPLPMARLLKINGDEIKVHYKGRPETWGKYLRYNYLTFDFSEVRDTGLFCIEYGNTRTKPFRIANDIFHDAWQPTLDVFFPVQMDHMFVKEAYRVWHGASHLDDALQAPVNHKHFDLYEQGPSTDTPYQPGEHIPGLNKGGWFDAGDFDIRTQTQYSVVQSLVHTWETFHPERDETYIDQETGYVELHHPDGKYDILQQIEHGAIALLAQHKAVGHAINGIIVSHLSQYTHLGDALTMTDNLIFNPVLDSLESDGFSSGTFDDRWAFTNRSTSLNYGSAAALAAAGRALQDYNNELAQECLATAQKVWKQEQSGEPVIFRSGNTTGGTPEAEQLKAAVELLLATREKQYAEAVNDLLPEIEDRFGRHAIQLVRAMPFMDDEYSKKIESLTRAFRDTIAKFDTQNPYGVLITTGGWAGGGAVIYFAITNYVLHKAFPDVVEAELVLRGLDYIYGCHPGSNISFVSGVGMQSKKVAYGNNRADFSFIAGGIVPGILVLPPDFPENKEDWPFLWGENEYVIGLGAPYIFLVQAAMDIGKEHM